MGGQYCYSLDASFFPDYKKLGLPKGTTYDYNFSYETRIMSAHSITNLSLPAGAEISEQNEDRTNILVRCSKVKRGFELYYRTFDMLVPSLRYARSNDDDKKVAV